MPHQIGVASSDCFVVSECALVRSKSQYICRLRKCCIECATSTHRFRILRWQTVEFWLRELHLGILDPLLEDNLGRWQHYQQGCRDLG
jgi:hypothetical protein